MDASLIVSIALISVAGVGILLLLIAVIAVFTLYALRRSKAKKRPVNRVAPAQDGNRVPPAVGNNANPSVVPGGPLPPHLHHMTNDGHVHGHPHYPRYYPSGPAAPIPVHRELLGAALAGPRHHSTPHTGVTACSTTVPHVADAVQHPIVRVVDAESPLPAPSSRALRGTPEGNEGNDGWSAVGAPERDASSSVVIAGGAQRAGGDPPPAQPMEPFSPSFVGVETQPHQGGGGQNKTGGRGVGAWDAGSWDVDVEEGVRGTSTTPRAPFRAPSKFSAQGTTAGDAVGITNECKKSVMKNEPLTSSPPYPSTAFASHVSSDDEGTATSATSDSGAAASLPASAAVSDGPSPRPRPPRNPFSEVSEVVVGGKLKETVVTMRARSSGGASESSQCRSTISTADCRACGGCRTCRAECSNSCAVVDEVVLSGHHFHHPPSHLHHVHGVTAHDVHTTHHTHHTHSSVLDDISTSLFVPSQIIFESAGVTSKDADVSQHHTFHPHRRGSDAHHSRHSIITHSSAAPSACPLTWRGEGKVVCNAVSSEVEDVCGSGACTPLPHHVHTSHGAVFSVAPESSAYYAPSCGGGGTDCGVELLIHEETHEGMCAAGPPSNPPSCGGGGSCIPPYVRIPPSVRVDSSPIRVTSRTPARIRGASPSPSVTGKIVESPRVDANHLTSSTPLFRVAVGGSDAPPISSTSASLRSGANPYVSPFDTGVKHAGASSQHTSRPNHHPSHPHHPHTLRPSSEVSAATAKSSSVWGGRPVSYESREATRSFRSGSAGSSASAKGDGMASPADLLGTTGRARRSRATSPAVEVPIVATTSYPPISEPTHSLYIHHHNSRVSPVSTPTGAFARAVGGADERHQPSTSRRLAHPFPPSGHLPSSSTSHSHPFAHAADPTPPTHVPLLRSTVVPSSTSTVATAIPTATTTPRHILPSQGHRVTHVRGDVSALSSSSAVSGRYTYPPRLGSGAAVAKGWDGIRTTAPQDARQSASGDAEREGSSTAGGVRDAHGVGGGIPRPTNPLEASANASSLEQTSEDENGEGHREGGGGVSAAQQRGTVIATAPAGLDGRDASGTDFGAHFSPVSDGASSFGGGVVVASPVGGDVQRGGGDGGGGAGGGGDGSGWEGIPDRLRRGRWI